MKRIIGLIFVIVLSFWSIQSLIGPGYFPMHDDTQVARVIVMGKALENGQFPVRWVSDLGYGYGYPLYNFYGPLPYYIGGSLFRMGMDSVMATKWMFGIGIVLAAVTMYLFLFPILGFLSAITGSIIFLYAPYHAVEIYIRGSVGEYWAIAFVPIILYGIWQVFNNKRTVGICIGAIGLAATIVSHTILGSVTTGLLIFFLVINSIVKVIIKKVGRNDWYLWLILLFGLSLSAFFWLPAFVEMRYTGVSAMITSSSTVFSDHFVCTSQLWNAPWGYGGSASGCVDGMSFKIGKLQSTLVLVALLVFFINRHVKRLKRIHAIVLCTVLCTAFILFLMLPYSSILWNIVPLTRFVQYPWRLLTFVTLGIGIMGGSLVAFWKAPIIRFLVAAGLVSLTIVVNAKLFVPQYVYLRDTAEFESNSELSYTRSRISDEYLPQEVPKIFNQNDVIQETITTTPTLGVKEITKRDTYQKYELTSAYKQSVILKIAYFPGWIIYINGKKTSPSIAQGLPSVIVSEGSSIIELLFVNTPVRVIANSISMISIVLLFGFYIWKKDQNLMS